MLGIAPRIFQVSEHFRGAAAVVLATAAIRADYGAQSAAAGPVTRVQMVDNWWPFIKADMTEILG